MNRLDAEKLAQEHNQKYRKKHQSQLYAKYDKAQDMWIVVYRSGPEEKVYSQ